MAIVKMNKFTLLAFVSKKEKLLEKLQAFSNAEFINLQDENFLENKEITTALPISFLWLHNDVTVILDEEAATCLKPEYK